MNDLATPPAYGNDYKVYPIFLDRVSTLANGMPLDLGTSTPAYVHETWLNGLADEECGSTEKIGGHWYRVEAYVVSTDSQGLSCCFEYATWMDAEIIFEHVRDQIDQMNPSDD